MTQNGQSWMMTPLLFLHTHTQKHTRPLPQYTVQMWVTTSGGPNQIFHLSGMCMCVCLCLCLRFRQRHTLWLHWNHIKCSVEGQHCHNVSDGSLSHSHTHTHVNALFYRPRTLTSWRENSAGNSAASSVWLDRNYDTSFSSGLVLVDLVVNQGVSECLCHMTCF